MREAVSLHMGQSGIQTGNACWELCACPQPPLVEICQQRPGNVGRLRQHQLSSIGNNTRTSYSFGAAADDRFSAVLSPRKVSPVTPSASSRLYSSGPMPSSCANTSSQCSPNKGE